MQNFDETFATIFTPLQIFVNFECFQLSTVRMNINFRKQPTSTLVEIAAAMLSKDNLIPIDRLTMENVTFWLYVVKFIRKSANDEEPNDPISLKLLPELTRYVKYLKE